MIPVNPGNLLPFYLEGYNSNDRRWQRHRQTGTDQTPFGLTCPRTRLLPFQVYFTGAYTAVSAWSLVSPVDDSTAVSLDVSLLTVSEMANNSAFWVTWDAETVLDVIPDCGYWYVVLNVAGQSIVCSEVLYCEDVCGFEVVGLEIEVGSCSVVSTNVIFTLEAIIEAGDGTVYTIQRKNGISYDTVASNVSYETTEVKADETHQYRIVATTECGLIITKTYTATWTSADACATLALALNTTSTNEAGILGTPAVWRMNMSNTTDKAEVLYQAGYKQYLYLPTIAWDVPEIERETDIRVNGNGEEIKRFTRTVERRGFEAADVPDYLLGFLSKAGDLDTILFEDAKMVDSLQTVDFVVENLTFESRRQGPALHIGRVFFEVETEAFQGCQEDYAIT